MRFLDKAELLETFERTAVLGGYRKAAEELQISKATVSRRIAALESMLGTKLFVRSSVGTVLSPSGISLLEKTSALLSRFQKLSAAPDEESPRLRGTIRVSAPCAIGNGLLIPWLTQFRRINPEVSLDLTLTLGPMHIIPPECDVRINHGLYPCSNARILKLGDMRRMMVASVSYLSKYGYPKSPKDLERHELLGGNDLCGGSPLVLLKGNERAIIPYRPRLKLKDHTAARTAALCGAGISVHAFRYDTLDLVRRGLLIHVLPEWEPSSSPVSLLLPTKKEASAVTIALCHFIVEKWQSNPNLTFSTTH